MPVIDRMNMTVIHKDYVLDYTSALKNVIIETEGALEGFMNLINVGDYFKRISCDEYASKSSN